MLPRHLEGLAVVGPFMSLEKDMESQPPAVCRVFPHAIHEYPVVAQFVPAGKPS